MALNNFPLGLAYNAFTPVSDDSSNDPLTVLKKLRYSGDSPNNAVDLYNLQDQRRDELKHNLQLEAEYPGRIYGGATPSDVESLGRDLAPMDRDIDAYRQANLQGFTSPAEANASQMAMEAAKINSPVQVEREKTRGAVELQKSNYGQLRQLLGAGAESSFPPPMGSIGSQPQAQGQQAAPPPTSAAPTKSQSWWDFLTGKGPNSLGSMADAANERLKYGFMATPYSKLMQDVSFANLQQLSGQFPGVRGFSYLLPKLQEHQANVGKESWQATYNRLKGMDDILTQTDVEMRNPSLRISADAEGRPRLNMPPQTVARGLLSLQDAHKRIQDAIQELESLHPEVKGGGQSSLTPDSSSRFRRIQ